MKKITLISVVVSLLLTAGACLIAMRAACHAEDRIRAQVEPILASEGLYVTVRLQFGTAGTAISQSRN